MAKTKRRCPNCQRHVHGAAIYRCRSCHFEGCLAVGFFGNDGCWKQRECPRCDSRSGHDVVARIGECDSN